MLAAGAVLSWPEPVAADTSFSSCPSDADFRAALTAHRVVSYTGATACTVAITAETTLTEDLTINGNGLLTIEAAGTGYRFLNVPNSSVDVDIVLNGLTIQQFQGAAATSGGAIFVGEDQGNSLTLSRVTMRNNTSPVNGGAIFMSFVLFFPVAPLTVSDSLFEGNHAGLSGGAVAASHRGVSANGVTFANNSGGAILTAGTTSITNSTFDGNSGGGGSTVTVNGNFPTTITHSTIRWPANNGFRAFTGSITVTSSLIAGPDCGDAAVDASNLTTVTCSNGTVSNTLAASLGALADNGGFGRTIAYTPGSPAAGAISSGCPATDQRGRPRGSTCAAGAFELGSSTAPTLTGINPTSATAATDTTLTLTGTNFLTGPVVRVGGTVVASGYTSATSLTAIVPGSLLAIGSVPVTVQINGVDGGTTSSQTLTVNGQAQSISFPPPPATRRLDQGAFTINPTASSGLPVSVAVTAGTSCSLTGTTVSLLGIGSCSITASQSGNTVFAAANNVVRTFTVNPGNQTITFDQPPDRALADPPFMLTATASSDLAPVLTSLTPGVCTNSGQLVTIVGGGTCTIRASQEGNASWNAAADVDRSFMVAVGSQTISFPPVPDRTFGDLPFVLNPTASSGLATTLTSLTVGVCTVAGQVVTVVTAGTCTLQASQPGNSTWSAAPNVDRTFAIAQGSQTISFAPLADRAAGDPAFAIAPTASSGLAVTVISTTPGNCSVSGNLVTPLAAGTCTLQASQPGDGNWHAATPVLRSLTVTPGDTVGLSVPGGSSAGLEVTLPSGQTVLASFTNAAGGTLRLSERNEVPDNAPTGTFLPRLVTLSGMTYESAHLCFTYSETELAAAGITARDLRIAFLVFNAWRDATTSHDLQARRICGVTIATGRTIAARAVDQSFLLGSFPGPLYVPFVVREATPAW